MDATVLDEGEEAMASSSCCTTVVSPAHCPSYAALWPWPPVRMQLGPCVRAASAARATANIARVGTCTGGGPATWSGGLRRRPRPCRCPACPRRWRRAARGHRPRAGERLGVHGAARAAPPPPPLPPPHPPPRPPLSVPALPRMPRSGRLGDLSLHSLGRLFDCRRRLGAVFKCLSR